MGYDADTLEDWFEDVVAELPPFALVELLEKCIFELSEDRPTLH